MDLNTLRAFVVLAEEEHMTRAAERLHLTQPAISNKLKRLEAELSHPLFHRTPKGLTLTEAGEIFLVYAQEAIHTVEKGEEALQAAWWVTARQALSRCWRHCDPLPPARFGRRLSRGLPWRTDVH